jgi:phosphoglycerate dehydrogenase-like enzyme
MAHTQSVRVGIDDAIPDSLLASFPAAAKIVRLPSDVYPGDEVHTYEIDFWIPPFFRSTAERVFAQLRGVKVAQALMAGVDWLLWLPPGITLCDGRTIHNISTSEWVLSAILSQIKRLPHYRDRQSQHLWDGQVAWAGGDKATDKKSSDEKNSPHPKPPQLLVLGDELHGKRVLIVGYGAIGEAIEQRLTPFGVEITRVARSPRSSNPNGPNATPPVHAVTELDQLLPLAQIVILILPMTPETRGLIDARRIALLQPGTLLVNAARGPVVDTNALVAALEAGKISAAVDVTDPEPLPPEHPLWHAPNCLITPHVAASTTGLLPRAFNFAATQVERYINGQPLENIVGKSGY